MKLVTAFVAAAVGACLVVRAAPVIAEDGLLLERMVPVANVLVRRTEKSRSDGDDVTLGSSIVTQASDSGIDHSAQKLQNGQRTNLLEVRGLGGPEVAWTHLEDAMTDVNKPLLEPSEHLSSSLTDFASHSDATSKGKGKEELTEAPSSSGSNLSEEMSAPLLRTGQREMVEAELEARKAVASARKELAEADALVEQKKVIYQGATEDVAYAQEDFDLSRGRDDRPYYHAKLQKKIKQQDTDLAALNKAIADRTLAREMVNKKLEALEGKQAPKARLIVI